MYKKTIAYYTYDDEPEKIVEDFYFNINRAEIIQMQWGIKGGFEKYMTELLIKRDEPKILEFFTDLVKKSYGKRSPNGRGFIKNQEILDEFVQSEAYSELLTELVSNEEAASEFITNVFSSMDKRKATREELDQATKNLVKDNLPLKHALGMDKEEEPEPEVVDEEATDSEEE